MKKSFVKYFALGLVSAVLFSGCYGNFALTKKLYTWNGSVGDKFINSGVMWVMMILPVYGAAGFVDFAFLNLVEFWTGSNPLAMDEGKIETQIVEKDGVQYKIIAEKNQYHISRMEDGVFKAKVNLEYKASDNAWYAVSKGETVKLAESMDDASLVLYGPEGERFIYDLEQKKLVN